jgi:anti-sigma regulatory factor (Ser/Thr protein kinase)
VSEITLAPNPDVPAQARRLIERTFGDALAPDELKRARVAISELATNAVRHGQGEVTVRAELDDNPLLVDVIDRGSDFARRVQQHDIERIARWVQEHDVKRIGGWGLSIVDAETSRWGVHEGTTHVWFEIERHGPRVGIEEKPK